MAHGDNFYSKRLPEEMEMTISVNSIPSKSVPFTDSQGRINPIWHEFLRSFVSATVDGTISEDNATTTVSAGPGLTGGGTGAVTLSVGAGPGIAVNADDVSVDIPSLTSVQPAPDDLVMIADFSDNNALRKTKVSNIVGLSSPGGLDTYVQYNNNSIFGGDSGFTYDGAGNATLTSGLTFNNGMSLTSGATDKIQFDGLTGANDPKIISSGTGSYGLYAGTSGFDSANMIVGASAGNITFNLLSTSGDGTIVLTGDSMTITGRVHLMRCISAALTASTTQTQGQGALLSDYHIVNTVANDNDTVTLPPALASQYCMVRNGGANILKVFPASGDDLGAGVNVAITMRPGENYSWVAIDATTWHTLEGLVRHSVASGLTASVTQTQGQQALTKDVNEISTCANANDVVTMPAATAFSRSIKIINNGAQILQIFPATGDNLGAGVNTSVTLASGANVCYTNYDVTNWRPI